jgi:uncharacterized protein
MAAVSEAPEFSAWLASTRAAIVAGAEAVVPCGTCTACCRASQFVAIEPDEVDTLAHIPGSLVFPAPRRPAGHVLLGYDEHGHCPMLVDDACSIYDHRPRACRTYDCRVFAATGTTPVDETKVEIAARVRGWQFAYPTDRDRAEQEAVTAAAGFIDAHPEAVVERGPVVTETQRAVLALELYRDFLPPDPDGP